MEPSEIPSITLNNGVKMPVIGYGVYQIDPADCVQCVNDALMLGYRSIDTASAYHNEEAVGEAVVKSGIPRREIFLTSKIWITDCTYEKAKAAINSSLKKLKTYYIDLMLIHQPFNDYYGAYRAMEEACKSGKIRAIGVSNFYPDRLIDLCKFAGTVPAVNQVETHVYFQQKDAHSYMKKYGVVHQSWGPFAEGRNNFFNDPVLKKVGISHGKSAAQVALKYLLQNEIPVIPKSAQMARMAENIDIFDFELTDEEMSLISGLDMDKSAFFSHYSPETLEHLTEVEM